MKTNSQQITLAEILGPIIEFLKNLIGPQSRMWLEAFKRFLRKENPWTEKITNIWKSILVGGKNAKQLIAEIEKNFRLGDVARGMMGKPAFVTSKNEKKVNFAVKTVRDFGFSESPRFEDFIKFFKNHPVYELCLPEDGPHLRLAYADQPKDEWIRLAMETIVDSDGDPGVFALALYDDGLWLISYWFYPDNTLSLDGLWVVRLRK
jgi:hypothetical protein